MALKVSHLEEHVEKLGKKGIKLYPARIEFLPTFLHGVKHIFLYGPSGERIELADEYEAGGEDLPVGATLEKLPQHGGSQE